MAENQPVPDLRAPDLQGAVHSLADFPGRVTLLLFWQPDNQRSQAALCAMADLAQAYEPKALVSVVPGQHEKAEIERALEACSHRPAVLLDPERTIFGDFQLVALPTLMLIGADRRLKSKLAGFATEGLGQIQSRLDEIYGRRKPTEEAPTGAAEAIRRFGMAQQFFKLGMTAQAEGVLQSLTVGHPEFRPAWVRLGYRKIAAGRVDEAKTCLEKALDLDPKPKDVAAGMAWIWWKKGDPAQSAKWAASVEESDPNYGLIREMRK